MRVLQTGLHWEDSKKKRNWIEKSKTFFSLEVQGMDWKYMDSNHFAWLELPFSQQS